MKRRCAQSFFFVCNSATMSNVNYRQERWKRENQRLINWDVNREREKNGEGKTKEVIGRTEVHGAPYLDNKLPVLYIDNELVLYSFVQIFPLAFASSALILVVFHIAKSWCAVEIEDSFPIKRKLNISDKSIYRLHIGIHINIHIDIQRIRSNTFCREILRVSGNWFVNYLLWE